MGIAAIRFGESMGPIRLPSDTELVELEVIITCHTICLSLIRDLLTGVDGNLSEPVQDLAQSRRSLAKR